MSTPTSPLPAAAEAAMASLALRLTATRYLDVSERCAAASLAGDVDACLAAQDEMAHCLCQLRAAGRLDLIGGAR